MRNIDRLSAGILDTYPAVDEAYVEKLLQEEVSKNQRKRKFYRYC